MPRLFVPVVDSFTSPASMYMWLAVFAACSLILIIPAIIFSLRNRKGLFIGIGLSLIPSVLGLLGFITTYMKMQDALPNVPEAQREAAYRTGMEVAFSSFWPTVLTVLFAVLAIVGYKIAKRFRSEDDTGNVEGLASRGKRLAGAFIDGAILVLAILPVFLPLIHGNMSAEMTPIQQVILALTSIAAYALINGYLIHKNGQTVAKRLLNMKMVDAVTGEKASWPKVIFLRYSLLVAFNLIPFVGGLLNFLNSIFIFGKKRRCLHDYFAGTKVIDVAQV